MHNNTPRKKLGRGGVSEEMMELSQLKENEKE